MKGSRSGDPADNAPLVAEGLPARAAVVLGVAAGVVAIAGLAGALPMWPGLAHLVTLPPLGLVTDLRVLVPEATGYATFTAGTVAAVSIRTVVLALLLGGLDRRRLLFALRFHLLALPVALLAGLVTYAGHAGLYSGLHWIGMGLALLLLVVLGPAPWTGQARLGAAIRSSWRAGFRAWPVLSYIVALTAAGALAFPPGMAGWLAMVPASSVLTLIAVWWLARPAGSAPRWRLAAAGALVAAGVAALLVAAEPGPDEAPRVREGTLLVMSGMNSASGQGAVLEVDHPAVFGYPCEQVYYFSYAGPGGGQPQVDAVCPIRTGAPYTEEDTRTRPLEEQVELLAEQVREQIPPPITLLAHSQGAWVAWQAATEGLLDGVETLVVIGPFPDSALGWPPPGEAGPGRVGWDFLRLLQPVTRAITFAFDPDEPLASDVLETPSVPRGIYEQPLPDHLRVLSVFGIGDLPLNPGGWRIDGAVDACPRHLRPPGPASCGWGAAADQRLPRRPATRRLPPMAAVRAPPVDALETAPGEGPGRLRAVTTQRLAVPVRQAAPQPLDPLGSDVITSPFSPAGGIATRRRRP